MGQEWVRVITPDEKEERVAAARENALSAMRHLADYKIPLHRRLTHALGVAVELVLAEADLANANQRPTERRLRVK